MSNHQPTRKSRSRGAKPRAATSQGYPVPPHSNGDGQNNEVPDAPSPDDQGVRNSIQALWEFVERQFAVVIQALTYLAVQGEVFVKDGESTYVTLRQCSAMVQRSKRTLEKKKSLPEPDIRGEGGAPNEWKWSTIRPWLEATFGRKLPDVPPCSRRI